jgi:hypothetical protein
MSGTEVTKFLRFELNPLDCSNFLKKDNELL